MKKIIANLVGILFIIWNLPFMLLSIVLCFIYWDSTSFYILMNKLDDCISAFHGKDVYN